MPNSSAFEKITDEISALTREEKEILLKKLTLELESLNLLSTDSPVIKDIYGLGQGLWDTVDAEDFVESIRQDRIQRPL